MSGRLLWMKSGAPKLVRRAGTENQHELDDL